MSDQPHGPEQDTPTCTGCMGTDKLAAALAKAQAEYKPLKRTRTVTVKKGDEILFTYKYAPLDTCLDSCRAALSGNGLAITQVFLMDPLRIVTTLLHASGQSIQSTLPLRSGGSPQDLGGEMTYMRRYSLVALVGMAADEDTDGPHQGNQQQYDNEPPPKKRPPPKPKPKTGKPTKGELNAMYKRATGAFGWTADQLKGEIFLRYRVESSKDLTRTQFTEVQEWIKQGPPKETPPPAGETSPKPPPMGEAVPAGDDSSSAPEDPGTDAGDGGADTDAYAALADKVLKAKGDSDTKALLALAVEVGHVDVTDEQRTALVKMLEE